MTLRRARLSGARMIPLSDISPGMKVYVDYHGHHMRGVVSKVRAPNGHKGCVRVRVRRAAFIWANPDQLSHREDKEA